MGENATRKPERNVSVYCAMCVAHKPGIMATKSDDGDDDELKINSETMFNAQIQNPLNKLKWWSEKKPAWHFKVDLLFVQKLSEKSYIQFIHTNTHIHFFEFSI